jgi:hypothetical protein
MFNKTIDFQESEEPKLNSIFASTDEPKSEQLEDDDDSFSFAEREQLAAKAVGEEILPEETEPLLISQNNLYNKSSKKPGENPFFRTFLVLGITGIGLLFILWLVSIFNSSPPEKTAAKKIGKDTAAIENLSSGAEEADRLKAKLALLDQQSKPFPLPAKTNSTPAKLAKETAPVSRPVVRERASEQPSRVERIPTPPPPRFYPQPIVAAKPKLEATAPKENPLEKWASLAALGGSEHPYLASKAVVEDKTQQLSTLDVAESNKSSQTSEPTGKIPTIRIGTKPSFSKVADTNKIAKHTIGLHPASLIQHPVTLKSREPVEVLSSSQNQPFSFEFERPLVKASAPKNPKVTSIDNKTLIASAEANLLPLAALDTPDWFGYNQDDDALKKIAIGASVGATLRTPMLWNEGLARKNENQGQFTLTLSEPLKATDGEIALPAGTQLMAQTTFVAPGGYVQASAIAIAYQDSRGVMQQQEIPPGQLIILQKDNQPLIAKNLEDPGAAVAGQDILLGLLGAGAKGFEILNRPQSEETYEDDGFYSSRRRTRTTNNKANMTAAMFEGFFDRESKLLGKRAEKTTDEAMKQAKVYYLPANTSASIYLTGFLEIYR